MANRSRKAYQYEKKEDLMPQVLNRLLLPDEFCNMLKELKGIPNYNKIIELAAAGDPRFEKYLEIARESADPLTSLTCSGLLAWLKGERNEWTVKCLPQ